MDRLEVYLHGVHVGVLARDAEQPMQLQFDYASGWLARDDAAALSQSLPLRAAAYTGPEARNWFANLLPEGRARQRIAELVRVPIHDDFGLLENIGRECAGAVQLFPESTQPQADATGRATLWRPEDIDRWLEGDAPGGPGDAQPTRLSLAGAQDKLGVIPTGDGDLLSPIDDTPTTHILKAPNPRFPGLIALEAFGMRLARAADLPVASVTLWPAAQLCLLVERYDREVTRTGATTRLHQEDLCQALGLAPEHKYEGEHGPTLQRAFELLRDDLGLGPGALTHALRWVVCTALLGNADAHGKNLSLLRHRDGRIELAPAYDLVPTCVMSPAVVSRSLAMHIGTANTVDDFLPATWQVFARAVGVRPRLVEETLVAVADAIAAKANDVAHDLAAEGAPEALLARALDVIVERARAMRDGKALPQVDAADPPVGPWGMSL